jgi:hypothetical protein
LYTTEGSVFEEASVFACEGDALGYALIDDIRGHFGEAMDIAFAGAIIASFHRVVEKAIDAISVVLIIFCGVDSTLCGYTMSAAGAIMKSKALDIITEFAEGGCGCGAG